MTMDFWKKKLAFFHNNINVEIKNNYNNSNKMWVTVFSMSEGNTCMEWIPIKKNTYPNADFGMYSASISLETMHKNGCKFKCVLRWISMWLYTYQTI